MPETIALSVDPALYAHAPGGFIALSADSDLDAAFDDAVDTAWYEYGHAGSIPTIAQTDPGSIEITDPMPTTRALALRQAQLALELAVPGVVYARQLCSDGTYRRRRVSLVVTDPAAELPSAPGPVTYLDSALADTLLAAAGRADLGPSAGELLEAADLRTHRQRFKPVPTPHPGPTQRVFVAVDTLTGAVLAQGSTAGAARREAVAVMKEGPAPDGRQSYTLEVYQRVGREGDLPLITVSRTRVTQRASLRLSYLTLKNPDKAPRPTGWLFYGIPAPIEPEPELDTEPELDPTPEATQN